jgi:hypothetical protein
MKIILKMLFFNVFLNRFFIIILLILVNSNSYAASKWGKGELKLDDFVVEGFIQYIKGWIF